MAKTLTYAGMTFIENDAMPDDCAVFVGPRADGKGDEVKAVIVGKMERLGAEFEAAIFDNLETLYEN